MPAASLEIGLALDNTQFHSGMVAATHDVSSFADTTEAAGSKSGGFFGGLVDGVQKFATALPGLGMMAGAVHGISDAVLGLAGDANQATADIRAQFGLTQEDAQALSNTAVEIFGDNFGGSLADANAALMTTRANMKGLADEDLKAVTEGAIALSDTFELDVGGTTQAADTLMQKFGLSGQEALDFITTGMQDGLNTSGDFLESITEYGTQFASGGATAGQFFNLMKSGMQNGVLGTDKAADAFKEFRVRIQDGSTATTAALGQLGINSKQLSKDMADGTITAAQAFDMVLGKLNDTDDANIRMQAGVGLLGTQFEDLGTEGALALQLGVDGMADMQGATDSLNAKYSSLGNMWEGATRKMQVALMPLGNALLAVGNVAMPIVLDAVDGLVGAIQGGFAAVQPFFDFLQDAMGGEANRLENFMTGLPGPIQALGQFVGDLVGNFSFFFQTISDGGDIIQAAATLIGDNFGAAIFSLGEGLGVPREMLMGLVQAFDSFTGNIAEDIGVFIQEIQSGVDIFTAIGDQFPNVLDTLTNFVGSVVAWGTQAAQAFIAWIGPMIPPFLEQLGAWAQQTWDWLTGTALPALIANLGQWAGAFIAWIGPIIPPMLAGLMEMLGQVAGWLLGTALPVLLENLGKWAKAFVDWVGPQIPPMLAELQRLAGVAWDWLTGTALPALISNLGQWGAAFVAWIGPRIGPMLGELGGMLLQVGGWLIGTALPTIVGKLLEWGGAFLAWVGPMIPPLLGKMGELLGSLGAWLINEALPAIVTKLGEWAGAFLNWIGTSVLPFIGQKLGEFGASIITWIVGFATTLTTNANDMAGNLITGMVNGLVAGKDQVIQSLLSIATGALQAFKDFFGIQSPSTEMHDAGLYTTAGATGGIDEGAPAVIGAMQNMATGVLTTAQTMVPGMVAVGGQIAATLASWPGVWQPAFNTLLAAWDRVFGLGPGTLAYRIVGHDPASMLSALTATTTSLWAIYTGQGGPWITGLHNLDGNFATALTGIQATVRAGGQAIGQALIDGIVSQINAGLATVTSAAQAAGAAAASGGASGGGQGQHGAIHGPAMAVATAASTQITVYLRLPDGTLQELDPDLVDVVSREAAFGSRARNPRDEE